MKKITLLSLFAFAGALIAIFLVGGAGGQKNISSNLASSPLENTPSPSQSSGSNPDLTLAAIATHATPDDCYLAINNKVYNVSGYIDQHPGGRRNITSRCGQEVTGIFASIHSNFAWDLLAGYYIGDVNPGSGTPASGAVASNTRDTLGSLEQTLKNLYPQAEIISISPRQGFYVAKMIKDSKLFEAHIDPSGKVLQLEVANDEFDWATWDTDTDD